MAYKNDSELRIVLLGKTGSGKSSTGNTILKKQMFKVITSSRSVTEGSERHYRELGGKTIAVVDTPGLFDTHLQNTVKVHLEEAMKLTYPGPHVFLLVMRLDVKFTEEEKNTVKWFVETLGEEVQKHTIVLFTHGKSLEGTTIEQFVKGDPDFSKIVDNMAGYHVFENDTKLTDNNETQVTDLFKKIENLRKINKSQMYTPEMYEKVQMKKPKLQKKMTVFWIIVIAGIAGGGLGLAMTRAGLDETTSVKAGKVAFTVTAVVLGIRKITK